MVEKVTVSFVLRTMLGLWVAIVAFPSIATAHALDEYLQATMVDVGPESVHLQIYLTPGVAVADKVLAEIDTNHDGVISDGEAATYTDHVRRELVPMLDGKVLVLELKDAQIPPMEELHTGLSYLKFEFTATYSTLTSGEHWFRLRNEHRPAPSAYLFNAALPNSEAIKISGQARNTDQSEGWIYFQYLPASQPALPAPPAQHPGVLCALTAVIGAAAWWAYRRGRARAPTVAATQGPVA